MTNTENSKPIMSRNLREISIGGFYHSQNPALLRTLLGSCVSVCLHHPPSRSGGMNHILLPGKGDSSRYGMAAMEILINEFVKNGISRQQLKAKVFGGGRQNSFTDSAQIGTRNLEFVFNYLKEENIPVVAADIGGEFYRIIQFETDTFAVHLKRKPLQNKTAHLLIKEVKIANTAPEKKTNPAVIF